MVPWFAHHDLACLLLHHGLKQAPLCTLQGRAAPIDAHFNKGNRGIGFTRQHAQAHTQHERQEQQQQQRAEEAAAAAAERKHAADASEARGAGRKAKLQALVASELASESTDVKVKRYKQIEQ